jgi:hypothetical protein
MMTRSGDVQFCPGHLDVNEPGSFAPPEAFASNYKISRSAVEKMYIYSLGMTLYSAAEFETDKNADISDELEAMLLNMCEESVDARHSLSHVLDICDEHAQKSNCLDYNDQIIQLLENLMGSSAVLDKLGRSIDDLDDVDKDANLKEELAEALGMEKLGNSVNSLRSSAVSTPLNVVEGIGEDAKLETGLPLKPEDIAEPVASSVEGSHLSSPPTVKPLIGQATSLAAASAAVIMAAPAVSAAVSEAMPALEASQVNEFLQSKAKPELFVESEMAVKEETLPDSGAPPPLPESEPPPESEHPPDSEPPPLPDTLPPEDKPSGESPASSHPESQGAMQSSSGSSIGISHQESPAVVEKKDDIVQHEAMVPALDPGHSVGSSLLSSLLPGGAILSQVTRSDSKQNSDKPNSDTESKASEDVDAIRPVAQSTPVLEKKPSLHSWSGFHAQLAVAALGVQLRHVEPPSDKSESQVQEREDDANSMTTGTVTASSSIEEADHKEETVDEPTYAKVDLSKKKKYRQQSELETSDLKEETTMCSDTIDEADMVGSKSEASLQDESLIEVTAALSPQQGALAVDEQSLSMSEASETPSKKSKRKKKGRKDDKKLGTISGDEWSSVTKPSSKWKLKNMFGSDFSKLHGEARKPSVAILSGVETKLPPGRKSVTVIMLDGTELSLSVEMKSTVKELFDVVAAHLSLKDKEDYFFGLTAKMNEFGDEEWFMDPVKKVKKYAPTGWKDQKQVKFLVYFRVKYYVDHLRAIKFV